MPQKRVRQLSYCHGIPGRKTGLVGQLSAGNRPDFNWDIVIQNAKKTGTKNQIYIAIKYLNEFLPEKLPEIFKKGFRKKSVEILYNKLFLKNLAEKNEELKFTDIFKSGSSFLEYLEIKPKYFIYKRKMFRENIKLAKRILERQRMTV